jgi:2'-5' RNA ligase
MVAFKTNARVWKNYFDVVILPPPDVRDHAIDLSARLQNYGVKFVLGTRRYIPHISLYHIPVRPEKFEAFSREIEKTSAAFGGGELKFRSIELPLLMTDKPKWITRLYLDVINTSKKYFDWSYGAEDTWNMGLLPANLRSTAKRYLKTFGTPLMGAAFRPHITLTRLENKNLVDEIPPMTFKPMSFDVEAIHICELGPFHSCQRIVSKFPVARPA